MRIVLALILCSCGLLADGRRIDLSHETGLQTVIARGTESVYNGHATLARTRSGKLIAVWTLGHGGICGPAAESTDNGRSWMRIDGRFPSEWRTAHNCPAIYTMEGVDGKERLFVFAAGRHRLATPPECGEHFEGMVRCMSEDDGHTWQMLPELPVTCIMPLTTIIRCKDGSYLGLYNDRWLDFQMERIAELKKMRDAESDPEKRAKMRVKFAWNRVPAMRSTDGGFTWSEPVMVAESKTMNLCEPFLLRSDDGHELCMILRDNCGRRGFGTAASQLSFSRDEGRTWSAPRPAAPELSGHRHAGVRDSAGRWTIVSRCVDPDSPFKWHYCAWRGTYSDIVNGRPGEQIKLVHGYPTQKGDGDCGYGACVLLPDETVFAITYAKYRPGPEMNSVVGMFIPKKLLPASDGNEVK